LGVDAAVEALEPRLPVSVRPGDEFTGSAGQYGVVAAGAAGDVERAEVDLDDDAGHGNLRPGPGNDSTGDLFR
jgi:hypothetical protein